MKSHKKIFGYLLIVFLLGVWEIFSRSTSYPYLPTFSKTVVTLINNLVSSEFLFQISTSVLHAFIGLFIAILLMVPLGIWMGRNEFIYNLFFPIIEFFRPLPSAAIIPVAILFLGIENQMKLFVIVFGSLWPILLNTINGVRSIDPVFLKTAEVFKFNWKKKLFSFS